MSRSPQPGALRPPLPHDARLVGLGGYDECGKDTVARMMVEFPGFQHTYMSHTLELALLALNPIIGTRDAVGTHTKLPGEPGNPIKNETIRLRYADLHAQVGYDESKKSPEVRRLLRYLGTEVGRDLLGPDTWVKPTFEKFVDPQMRLGQRVVVTGIRFRNEIDAVHARGGLCLWIDRGTPAPSTHASNRLSVSSFDGVIPNHGTLDDLRATITKVFG